MNPTRLTETHRPLKLAALIGACAALTGCYERAETNQAASANASAVQTIDSAVAATATLNPTQGNEVQGVVQFTQLPDAILVSGRIVNLEPGLHGFHVHEKGDCSAPDGSSAGGHFAPEGSPHNARDAQSRHVGDLGNIRANEDGVAEFSFEDSVLALQGEHSILGKGLIVHQKADDFTSQPSGAAGPRVACGIITRQEG